MQVKGPFNRAGTDHLKRLKIIEQLGKRLKRIIVNAEDGSSFFCGGGGGGVWGEHARPEKF